MDGRKSIQVCQHSVFRKLQASRHSGAASLLGLPNELLTEIAEILYANEQSERHRCKKFTATWVLTRVSRRLRSIILPIIFRELRFNTHSAFLKFVSNFSTGEHRHLGFAVRCVPWLRFTRSIVITLFQINIYTLEDAQDPHVECLSYC